MPAAKPGISIGSASARTRPGSPSTSSDDRNYLSTAYGARLGKASVTGYCIKFKRLGDIEVDVLEEAIRFGFERRNEIAA
jgi:hypothetical protein